MAEIPNAGWAWFDPAPVRDDDDAVALKHAAERVFASAEGAALLRRLRQMTIERRLGPTADAREMRWLEGQRALVAWLEALAHADRPVVPPLTQIKDT